MQGFIFMRIEAFPGLGRRVTVVGLWVGSLGFGGSGLGPGFLGLRAEIRVFRLNPERQTPGL